MNTKDMLGKRTALLEEARALAEKEDVTLAELDQVKAKILQAKELGEKIDLMEKIKSAGAEIETEEKALKETVRQEAPVTGFKHMGQWLVEVQRAGNVRYRGPLHPGLKRWTDSEDPAGVVEGWEGEQKATMQESTGARGGFLVPVEYRMDLLGIEPMENLVRGRATVIPMARRQVTMPVVDQTATTASQFHWFGGVIAKWTEESGSKYQTEPTFRQLNLVAHKLVTYSRSSDELLEDEGVGLQAFLAGPMGFRGAINAYEEYAFLRGNGTGQPLGVVNAGCTITIARQSTAAPTVVDLINMLEAFYSQGGRGVWMIHQSAMSDIMQISGPAGNASYLFIQNARDGAPGSLFGMPVFWNEKLPRVGSAGDILLANWPYYLVGDRKRTTIESTNVERFQYDETSWRCVHRVAGQPWLSAPLYLYDGTSTISPFVILGAKTT